MLWFYLAIIILGEVEAHTEKLMYSVRLKIRFLEIFKNLL